MDELAQKLSSDAPPTVFDANSSSTREKFGVIPGAKLLSSSSDYDVAASLPGDKAADLVFYCSNTRCTAAEGAAGRAVEAGYRSVSVLPEGIKGWVNAGQSTNNI